MKNKFYFLTFFMYSQLNSSTENLFYHFKCYNLTINIVEVVESFITQSHSSTVQDPMVENSKKVQKIIFFFGQCIRNDNFEWFLSSKMPWAFRG